MQRWKCEWVAAAVNCGMWWMTDSGGAHSGACRDSRPDPCSDQKSGRKGEKGRQINRERHCPTWRKEKGMREKGGGGGKKKKRGSTCFNFSRQRHEGHGRRERWVSEWEWSIIYLSSVFLTLILLSLFPPSFPSFHASVLLFLASRGSVAKANKQRRLFISAGGE